MSVVPLSCACKTFSWGKIGSDSAVAQLTKGQAGFEVDDETPYAELWMGTHPNGPSKLRALPNEVDADEVCLGEWIEKNPSVLGSDVSTQYGSALPYLFKVLSINKSLSIQAHPSKEHAKILHRDMPDKYKDSNHKPEMAIALTKFEALCGFRPVSEILNYFHEIQEFLSVVGQEAVDELINAAMASEKCNRGQAVQKALKHCVSCLMDCHADLVKEQLNKLVQRLDECHTNREDTTPYLGRLFLRIHSQFPGDVGCFIIYILNYIQLEPFESIFLGPNIPHAYFSGDIIECMACSDNVVRAGLTPKFKDVKTLINMLDYTPKTIAESKFHPRQEPGDEFVKVYNPPVDDFSVKKIQIPRGCTSDYTFKPINGPSIILTITGCGAVEYDKGSKTLHLAKGSVFFISCNEEIRLVDICPDEEVLIFQAYCDLVRTA